MPPVNPRRQTLAGVQADSIAVALGAIALVATVAAIDALRGLDLLRPLIAELPSVVRLVKGRPGFLPLRLRHEQCRIRGLRLGLALRLGLVTRNMEKQGESRQNIARLFSPAEPAYRDERARDERKSPHATRGHRRDARFSPIAASNPRADSTSPNRTPS